MGVKGLTQFWNLLTFTRNKRTETRQRARVCASLWTTIVLKAYPLLFKSISSMLHACFSRLCTNASQLRSCFIQLNQSSISELLILVNPLINGARVVFFSKPAIERWHYRQLFSPPISTILNEVQGGGLEREIPIVRGCPYFLKLVSSLTSNISMHILHSIPLYLLRCCQGEFM